MEALPQGNVKIDASNADYDDCIVMMVLNERGAARAPTEEMRAFHQEAARLWLVAAKTKLN